MKHTLQFAGQSWSQYTSWVAQDLKMLKRINRLIEDIDRDPDGIGIAKPELLKGPLSGWLSRRIDREHRLVYRVRSGVILIASCRGHYTNT